MKILRVNMQTRECTKEEQEGAEQTLGGRALIAKILQEEVEPSCEPFSAKNKIIITNGCMAG
ncbi:MAG: aldehyde ferredoxin oxidoreductase N-terminal domain-containing protein, partial [Clostridia bacterium]